MIEPGGAVQRSPAAAADDAAAVQWQRTLWVMVGIQFIMTGAFSVLSPIHAAAPARARRRDGERGRSVGRHPQWRRVLCRGLCFAGMGTRRRPPRPQADAVALESS